MKSFLKQTEDLFEQLIKNQNKALQCWKTISNQNVSQFLVNFKDLPQSYIDQVNKNMTLEIKLQQICELLQNSSKNQFLIQSQRILDEIRQVIISEDKINNRIQNSESFLSANIKDQIQNIQKSKIKMKQLSILQPALNISQAQLEVIVKNYQQKFQINYYLGQYKLKILLEKYIYQYLQKNQLTILKPIKKIRILDEILYEKSSDAGNYKFDPFCDCIDITVRRKDNQLIKRSIKIKDSSKLTINFKNLKQSQIKSSQLPNGRDNVEKLLKIICQKKQQTEQMYQKVVLAFTQVHGVKIISDLYPWSKQDYSKLNLKLTWVYQMQQSVQKIKDFGQKNQQYKLHKISEDKKHCFKIANSHKILRYLIYKVHGFDELRYFPKINFQNMKKAISIVKRQIINDQLLDQLQDYFFQFTDTPKRNQKTFSFSRGMVLFGPPGTGKTQLTESLPNLIGFHLIEKGLSAADFMKTHVGESSRMIRDLVNRAKLSPHLICSIGIDEIDGLVPDRKDKDQKNKGQGISMLLSVIGGNKDVPNLVFMASTNHLKKIDQAIRRRLSGQFQVGRPNPTARKILITNDLPYLTKNPELLQKLITITANFTGAALKKLNATIHMKMKKKQMQKNKIVELNLQQILSASTKIAKQFSITLGIYTFPEIYALRCSNKFMFTINFLNKIARQFMMVSYQGKGQYNLYYSTMLRQFVQDKQKKRNLPSYYYEKDSANITLDDLGQQLSLHFQVFEGWVNNHIKNVIVCNQNQQLKKYLTDREELTILLIKESEKQAGSIFNNKSHFQSIKKNLYVLYYVGNLKPDKFMKSLNWITKKEKPFSGRVLVQLNQQPRMAFELNSAQKDQNKLYFKYFLKSEKTNSPNDVIPELIQFFNSREVSFVLLLDYQLILQNGAFDEQKMFQVIQQKMGQAMNYNNVAIIINLDSLIVLNQSSSDSSMGRSQSYSIADHNMYRLLLHYMRQFSLVDDTDNYKKQKWISIIVKNPQLIKLVKSDLKWPLAPEQRQKRLQQETLHKQRKCARCGSFYTQDDNLNQRKCVQHPGPLIDMKFRKIQSFLSIQQARLQQIKYKQRKSQKDNKKQDKLQHLYVFACCLKGINQQGQCSYRHVTTYQINSENDELYLQKKKRQNQWAAIAAKL